MSGIWPHLARWHPSTRSTKLCKTRAHWRFLSGFLKQFLDGLKFIYIKWTWCIPKEKNSKELGHEIWEASSEFHFSRWCGLKKCAMNPLLMHFHFHLQWSRVQRSKICPLCFWSSTNPVVSNLFTIFRITDRITSRNKSQNWPSDLNSFGYFPLGYISSKVYENKLQTIEELKKEIWTKIADVDQDLCERVLQNSYSE